LISNGSLRRIYPPALLRGFCCINDLFQLGIVWLRVTGTDGVPMGTPSAASPKWAPPTNLVVPGPSRCSRSLTHSWDLGRDRRRDIEVAKNKRRLDNDVNRMLKDYYNLQ